MSIARRIAKLESALGVRPDADGRCGYCRGRTDLGHSVLYDQIEDGPVTLRPGNDPTPTPCPRCGRDTNFRIIFNYVNTINQRRAEMGLEPIEGMGRVDPNTKVEARKW